MNECVRRIVLNISALPSTARLVASEKASLVDPQIHGPPWTITPSLSAALGLRGEGRLELL
jgi:hypothetical protein